MRETGPLHETNQRRSFWRKYEPSDGGRKIETLNWNGSYYRSVVKPEFTLAVVSLWHRAQCLSLESKHSISIIQLKIAIPKEIEESAKRDAVPLLHSDRATVVNRDVKGHFAFITVSDNGREVTLQYDLRTKALIGHSP